MNLGAKAQPPICGNNPAMTSFCAEACIICDIDGFTGRNNSSIQGQAPPGFCTTTVHHMQWIGFIAGTSDLNIEITVFNCNSGQGLEVGLYESFDCSTFRKVSECDTDIREGEIRAFINTVPLTIGQYYYFVMDGNGNDICNYSIKVKSGSTKVLPLDMAAEIIVPDQVCQNELFEMKTPGLSGATYYNWTIDGAYTKNGSSVEHSLDKPGTYKICLEASNVCDQAPPACKTIEVLPVPVGKENRQICFGECYTFYGNKYCETGIYEVRLPAANGCDSIVLFDLLVDDRITAYTSVNICDGDTLFIGNSQLFNAGKHDVIISNQEGCNIYLEIDLSLIICNIGVSSEVIPVRCNGMNDGSIQFSIEAGSPPFSYKGYKIENASVVFNGNIDGLGKIVNIGGLDEGNYIFTIEDGYGNSTVFQAFVPQPALLTVSSEASEYNSYQISCYGDHNGYFRLVPSGGNGPYTFSHDGLNSISDEVSDLIAGKYTSRVTDSNGCVKEIVTTILQPDPLEAVIKLNHPNCTGYNTGLIDLSATFGGVGPYMFKINEQEAQDNPIFDQLSSGTYSIEIQDRNGCITTGISALNPIAIPDILADKDELSVDLGDSIELRVWSNLSEQFISWTPNDVLSCKDCLISLAKPLFDTDFKITVTSADGCSENAVLRVRVNKPRSFTIANVFTPNGDNQNDKIRYFAGKDVSEINYLNIYDRWGNLIYKSESLQKGLSELDWAGDFQSDKLQAGAYTWICQLTYIDGVILNYKGSFTIIK